MDLETIKKSFLHIQNLSDDDLKDLLSDNRVLIGYNRLSRVFPSYFHTIENLVESSKDLKLLDDVYNDENKRVGVKFKVNGKTNGIFILEYDYGKLYLSYSINDIKKLSNTSVKNKLVDLITKEYKKSKNTIKPFFGDENITVLETISERQPIQILLGDKTLLHSKDFKEYFDNTLIPHLKLMSDLIQKKIKKSIEADKNEEMVKIEILTKYVEYDRSYERETYREINSHHFEIDKKILDNLFIITDICDDEDTDEEYEETRFLSEDDIGEILEYSEIYTTIIDNINYVSEIQKFYYDKGKIYGSIFFEGLKLEIEYKGDKKIFDYDFGKLKNTDDLHDYYEDYAMRYENGKFQSN